MFEDIIYSNNPYEKFCELRAEMSDDIFFNKITRYDLFLLLKLEYNISEPIWKECVTNMFGIVQIMNKSLYTTNEIFLMSTIKITDNEVPKICIENGIRFFITINDLKLLSKEMFSQIEKNLFFESDRQYLKFKKGTGRW